MKTFKLIVLLLLITILTYGQKGKFDIGFVSGPSYSSFFGDYKQSIISSSSGFSLQYNFKKRFSLNANILYERKGEKYGGHYTNTYDGSEYGFFTRSNYLDYYLFPIFLKSSFGKNVKVFFNVGAFGGFLISAISKIKYDLDNEIFKADLNSDINRYDFGIVSGIGINIPVKDNISLFCELRNNNGLKDNFINNPDLSQNLFSKNKLFTNSTNLFLGISYALPNKQKMIELTNALAYKNDIEIGIEGGPTYSFMPGGRRDSIIGFSSGISFQYNINRFFSLKSNLSYERKGDARRSWFIDYLQHYAYGHHIEKRYFDYFTAPILFRTQLGKNIKCFFNVGPHFGYLNNATSIFYFDSGTIDVYAKTKSYKRLDLGMTSGIGISVPIKENFSINAELRNNSGLVNILKGYMNYTPLGYLATNSTNLLIGISYKVPKNIKIYKIQSMKSKTFANVLKKRMNYAVEVGPNYTFITKLMHSNSVSFAGGFAFQYQLSPKYSIRSGIFMERKSISQSQMFSNFNIIDRFDFISIPLLIRRSIGNKEKYFFNIGPYYGNLCKAEAVAKTDWLKTYYKHDNAYKYNKYDVGVSTGLGMNIPINSKILLSLELRNNLGLKDIFNENYNFTNKNYYFNSTNLLFGVSYKISNKQAEENSK